MRPKALAVVLLLALTGSACAGEVGKYRNAAVGPDGTILLGNTPAAAVGQQAAAAANPGMTVTETTAPGATTAVTEAAAATTGGAPAVGPSATTPVSGPAARYARQAAAGPVTQGPSTGAASAGSGATPAPGKAGAAAGTGGSSAGSGSGAASGGTAVPAPVPTGPGTTTGVTKDTITVGLFMPKTGAYAGIARNGPAVAEAAFVEAGLVNGRRIVVKYYDDGTANASTIQVEEKRAKDEVLQYISLVGESNVVLAPLAEQHKIPLVIGNIDRKVALPLTYSFPVFAYWAYQASVLPGFIKNVLGGGAKKIGIVYETTSTAIDARNAFKDKAKELGLSVVFEQPIAQNQSACANEVANLQSHGVELVFMMNGPLGAICMLRDARALAYKPIWTGVGISWNFNIVSQATGGAPDGVRMLRTSPTLESPEGRHYAEVMRRAAPNSGADTDDLLLAFYSVLQSVIEGLRRAGPGLTREGLVRTWETKMNGYDSGYLPPPTFGPGNRSGPLVVGVSACCTNNQWTTPQQGWRAAF